jgi:MOSC domain-containing protein YiiM
VPVGRIASINVSNGGVPKLPIPSAHVSTSGMEGDAQADRKHHGGPDQALCLFSLEVIEGWQAEGHPIEPGSVGENLTIQGIDWNEVGPGALLRVGDDLVAEVTWPATPCSKQRPWFTDGDFSRLSEVRHPGQNRWYAKVLTPGRVALGDPVVLEPSSGATMPSPDKTAADEVSA